MDVSSGFGVPLVLPNALSCCSFPGFSRRTQHLSVFPAYQSLLLQQEKSDFNIFPK